VSYLDDPVTDEDYDLFIADMVAMGLPSMARGDLVKLRLAHADVKQARAIGDEYGLRLASIQRSSAHTRVLVSLRSL
jgi:hypothetical protein